MSRFSPSSATRPVQLSAYAVSGAAGVGIEKLQHALSSGQSGLRTDLNQLPEGISPLHFPACIGLNPTDLPAAPEGNQWRDTRQLRMAWSALGQIESEVAEVVNRYGARRVALILGTSTGGISSTETALLSLKTNNQLPADYSCMQGHAMDAAARHMAEHFGILGPVFAVSSACASGAKALATGKRLLNCGLVDAVLAGGVDSIARMTLHGFHSLQVLSSEACRPFDDSISGMNVAEGAALFVMEREGSAALGKTATGSATDEAASGEVMLLMGVGESSDAHHMSAPDPSGESQERAMRAALEDAGLSPQDICYVNAHGTGTRANDSAEGPAISRVFGDSIPASSTKGLFGHQLGAAGATEAVISLEVAQGQALCPSGALNPEAFPLAEQKQSRGAVLSNSFAFGGANISLVFAPASRKQLATQQPASNSSPPSYSAWVKSWASVSSHAEYSGVRQSLSSGELAGQEEISKFGADLLPTRTRARAGELTRLLCEAAARLGLDKERLAQTPILVGSALGQVQTTKSLIELFLADDSSPLAFQSSVHNATAGALSISLKNRLASSSIAGGHDTFYATLVEALTLLYASEHQEVLLLIGDEKPPTELGLLPYESAAAALLLSREQDDHAPTIELRLNQRSATLDSAQAGKPTSSEQSQPLPHLAAIAANISSPALAAVAALEQSRDCSPNGAKIPFILRRFPADCGASILLHPALSAAPQLTDSSPLSTASNQPAHEAPLTHNYRVEDLLPHRAPMTLLDEVINYGEQGIRCRVGQVQNQAFSEEGMIDAVVATEWMAQAVGAYVGATRMKAGQKPRVGFIIGSRKIDYFQAEVSESATLLVDAVPVWLDAASGNFICSVFDALSHQLIAQGSLTVHEPGN